MEEICLNKVAQISVGNANTRLKEKIYEDGIEIKFITPKSIKNNFIEDKEIEKMNLRREDIKIRTTQENDIIVKTTTPFDVVFIDKKHEGLLYNSFCINITVDSEIMDSKFLFAFLNTKFIKNKLENKAKSYKTTPISKKDIEEIKIPYLEKEKQELIGKLYINIIEKEKIYNQMIQKEKEIVEEIIFSGGKI